MSAIFKCCSLLLALQFTSGICAEGAYETGRLDLPFVGHATFGVPNDMGTQWRSGARMGPRGIREASTLYSFGHKQVYDADTEETYEYGEIVDVGDVDVVHTDVLTTHNRTQKSVEIILEAGKVPIIMGGDHSITTPNCAALAVLNKPIVLVQIDAHLDFVDERHGVRFGHGNPMRRCLEMPHITKMFQLGIRGVSSTAKSGFDDAQRMGSTVMSVRKVRQLGIDKVAAMIPENSMLYFSIDIDGLDPSIAGGTGTPSHGGFTYYEVKDILRSIIGKADKLVGLDLVEVSPPYDPMGVTTTLAARILLDAIGFAYGKMKGSGKVEL